MIAVQFLGLASIILIAPHVSQESARWIAIGCTGLSIILYFGTK